MQHRELLVALDPIVAADSRGRIFRLTEVLREHDGDWGEARRTAEVQRLDDATALNWRD